MVCKLCIFQIYSQTWKLVEFEDIFVLYILETSLATNSNSINFFLLVCKLCKFGIKIINYILKVSRYTNIVVKIYKYCLYWEVFSMDKERFFSTVCCFFSFTCRSVNCMSWVSKFHSFFQTCLETEARFMLEDFKYSPL